MHSRASALLSGFRRSRSLAVSYSDLQRWRPPPMARAKGSLPRLMGSLHRLWMGGLRVGKCPPRMVALLVLIWADLAQHLLGCRQVRQVTTCGLTAPSHLPVLPKMSTLVLDICRLSHQIASLLCNTGGLALFGVSRSVLRDLQRPILRLARQWSSLRRTCSSRLLTQSLLTHRQLR